MDLDKTLGRLALIVPVTHVVACSIYLAGYSNGFGAKIGTLFSVTDFFTVSLDRLVMMYTLGLGIPLVFLLVRHRSGITYKQDQIAAIEDADVRAREEQSHRNFRNVLTWGLSIGAALGAGLMYLSTVFDTPISHYLGYIFILIGLNPLWWLLCQKARFHGPPAEIAWIALFFAVSLFGLGVDAGRLDRRAEATSLKQNRYHCGRHTVLATAGDRFISVTPDGQRHIIDDECKIVFSFNPVPPPRPISTGDALEDWIAKKLGFHQPATSPNARSPS